MTHTDNEQSSELRKALDNLSWNKEFKSTNTIDLPNFYIMQRRELIDFILDFLARHTKEAVEAARAREPLTCEYGHEVYSHKTADGWCCACEADRAFMEGRIREAKLTPNNLRKGVRNE